MTQVLRTPLAAQDLLDIWMFIVADSPKHATRLLKRVDRACSVRADFPGSGKNRDDIKQGIRSFPVGKYLVFYRAMPTASKYCGFFTERGKISGVYFTD